MSDPYTLVIANGDMPDPHWLQQQCADAHHIVAVDGGCNHLRTIDHYPDYLIGDLDSVTTETLSWLAQSNSEIQQYNAEKDETDLELALLLACTETEQPIRLAAVLGGRADQAFANLLMLARSEWRDRDIAIVTPHEHIFVFEGTATVSAEIGATISLLPLAGSAHVAHTTGLKWPLNNSVLKFGYARGVSNVLEDKVATIELNSGIVACIVTTSAWQR